MILKTSTVKEPNLALVNDFVVQWGWTNGQTNDVINNFINKY